MLAFINGVSVVNRIKFNLPFTNRQRALGETLFKHLINDLDNPPAEDDLNPLHDFIVSIFDTRTSEAPEERSLFLAVLAIRAVKSDGSFLAPERVPPELARLHYLCNVAILFEGERNGSDCESHFLR